MAANSASASQFTIQYTNHTLNTLAANTILLHSTNCFGIWGAGFALALHEQYPIADQVYAAHCDAQRPGADAWPSREKLIGTCLLIPPQMIGDKPEGKGVWIACLFTSYGYGRSTKKKAGKDTRGQIMQQTKDALNDLKSQIAALSRRDIAIVETKNDNDQVLRVLKEQEKEGNTPEEGNLLLPITEIYSPKFNSGSFGVQWEDTENIVKDVFRDWKGKWFVIAPP